MQTFHRIKTTDFSWTSEPVQSFSNTPWWINTRPSLRLEPWGCVSCHEHNAPKSLTEIIMRSRYTVWGSRVTDFLFSPLLTLDFQSVIRPNGSNCETNHFARLSTLSKHYPWLYGHFHDVNFREIGFKAWCSSWGLWSTNSWDAMWVM